MGIYSVWLRHTLYIPFTTQAGEALNPERLLCETLRTRPWGAQVTRIMAAALAAADPARAVRQFLRCDGDWLLVGEQRYDLRQIERIRLVAVGKASPAMAQAAAEILGKRLSDGLVISKGGSEQPGPFSSTTHLLHYPSSHPVPDARSVAAGQAVARLVEQAGERDLVLALISGGGSALMALPAPGIALSDLQELTGQLLACGASIDEINSLRKHLDLLKGGGLARLAAPAAVAALLLSDVVGSPLDVIASGPAAPDQRSFADAYAVLERYNLIDSAPPPVIARLRAGLAGEVADTPKPGDPLFRRVQNLLVGSNPQAAQAAQAAAHAEGFHTLLLTTYLQGEAREAGRFLAAIAREIASHGTPLARPVCLIAGGETTVTIRGDGRGGRNQELALGAVRDLAGIAEVALVTLASDGEDGPTDAAGAVVTGETLGRAAALGLAPETFLARNDAYTFFDALDDLLKPGPSGTNVNDLVFLLMP